MKQIQTWANQLNAININSCEIATSLVQGAWPKTQSASSYICEHAGSGTPIFRDLIDAKHGCRESPKRDAAFARAKGNNQDIFVGDYNIAWKALSQMSLDEETKNLFMNITGTIVVKETSKDGTGREKRSGLPPMYKKALELLRFGGSMAKAYKIDKNEIDVKVSESLKIQTESAWKNRIFKLLRQIQEKILTENKERNQILTDEERNLISTTHFPMGSLLSLMTQYNGKGAIISIDRYSDLIAFERVLKFAEDVARDTLNKAEALRAAQVSGYELDEYIKQVNDVLKDLQMLTMENYQKISAEQQTIDYLINIDRTLREKETRSLMRIPFLLISLFSVSSCFAGDSDMAIHTYGGGPLLEKVFNAIAMILYGDAQSGIGKAFNGILRLSMAVGGFCCACLAFFREKFDPLFKTFFLPAVGIVSCLLVPRTSVLIVDHIGQKSPSAVVWGMKKIDNVPFFLGKFATLTSEVSYRLERLLPGESMILKIRCMIGRVIFMPGRTFLEREGAASQIQCLKMISESFAGSASSEILALASIQKTSSSKLPIFLSF